MKTVIVASHNKKKIDELKDILQSYGFNPISRDDAGIDRDYEVLEDGKTFEENSFKKASQICKLSGEITLADDSGLVVDALDGEPGVHTSRYAGEDASDDQNNDKLLRNLEGVSEGNRTARFVDVITLCFPNGKTINARGEVKGKIAKTKMGSKGFGYDPIFIPDGYDTSFAVLGNEVKYKIGHRAKAIETLSDKLKQMKL